MSLVFLCGAISYLLCFSCFYSIAYVGAADYIFVIWIYISSIITFTTQNKSIEKSDYNLQKCGNGKKWAVMIKPRDGIILFTQRRSFWHQLSHLKLSYSII